MTSKFLAGAILMILALSAQAAGTPETMKPFERGSWRGIVKAHAGRPTLVHFWGVTCGPCKVELPQLGAFMKDHPAIDMVTISADLVPNLPDATRAMLRKSGLSAAENWIFNDGFVERLRFEIDPNWQGDIPRTLLIARDGEITTWKVLPRWQTLRNGRISNRLQAADPAALHVGLRECNLILASVLSDLI